MAKQIIDFYKILGVDSDATAQEIKKAYRNLSKVKHPDVCKEEQAEENWNKILKAYEELSDPELRKQYDEFVASAADGSNKTFEDVYQDFFSGVTAAHSPVKGESIEIEVEFLVDDIRQQTHKVVQFDRFVNCGSCEGHGFKRFDAAVCIQCSGQGFHLTDTTSPFGDIKTETACGVCSGKGYVNTTDCGGCEGKGRLNKAVELTYQLPEDTREGYRYVLKGRGDHGLNGGKPGDLILVLKQSETDEYSISDTYDLHKTIKVPYVRTLTGGKAVVSLPRGGTKDVPVLRFVGTGHQIVLPNEGLVTPGKGFNGTLTLHVEVEMPQRLSDEKVEKLIEILS